MQSRSTLLPPCGIIAPRANPGAEIAGLARYVGGITLSTQYNSAVKKFRSAIQIVIQP